QRAGRARDPHRVARRADGGGAYRRAHRRGARRGGRMTASRRLSGDAMLIIGPASFHGPDGSLSTREAGAVLPVRKRFPGGLSTLAGAGSALDRGLAHLAPTWLSRLARIRDPRSRRARRPLPALMARAPRCR